ncbi:hypothetical protein BDV11DRAFT_211572 [Aspergillus similis]
MIFEPELRVSIPDTDILTYIFANPSYDANRPVYIDVSNPSRSISLAQARTMIRQLIAGLRAWGAKEGDCVAIHSFNDIYYSMLVLAIIGLGGIFTGTNPSYTTHELAHHFRTAEVRFVLSEPEILGSVLEAAKVVGIPDGSVRVFNSLPEQAVPQDRVSWKELLNHGEEFWIEFDDEVKSRTTAAARLFSSGTTGLPKAVSNTHKNLIAQQELVYQIHPRDYQRRDIVATPVFHAAVAPITHVGALKSGQIYQITDLILVPPIAVALVMNDMTYEKPYLRSVRHAVCGAAPLDKDVQRRLGKLLGPGAPFTQVWGMTETNCLAMCFNYPETDDTGSVGRLIANVEAKLVDDQGKNISAYNTRGELCVRGPTVTPGYLNNPAANAESFDEDGWFHTGDIAYCDAESRKWYIVDRKKELIKVRGFQVAPPELEAVLLSHPLIVDAAVIGIKDKRDYGSELVRAYVVRRPGKGEGLTEDEVKKYLGQRLAKYKALTGGVRFVESIQKTASGKILKRLLREEAERESKAKL